MGRGPATGGVENHNGRCRIYFLWQGKRCRPVLPLAYTPANIKAAKRMVAEIRQKISYGVFNPGDYFPDMAGGIASTFGDYADRWLAVQAGLAKSTRQSYEGAHRKHWKPAFATLGRPLGALLPSDVRGIVAGIPWATNKTRNNALIALRGAIELARADGVVSVDLMAGIDNLPHQAPPPDPWTREEAASIITWIAKRYPGEEEYYVFAFYTGMRCPSEITALRWEDVDLRAGTARVHRAKVMQELKDTKTHVERLVTLNDIAAACLERQRARTQLADGFVFTNGTTGRDFPDGQIPRRRLNAACKALGIRRRDAYHTRSSYATWAIMAGANPKWLAGQLGHSVMVLMKRYARWIESSEATQREMDKVNGAFGATKKERAA